MPSPRGGSRWVGMMPRERGTGPRLLPGIWALCLLLLAGAAHGVQPPPPFEARYRVHLKGYFAGQAIMSLEKTAANDWVFVAETKPEGLVALIIAGTIDRSVLDLSGAHVRPARFTQTSGNEPEPELEVGFDWTRRQMSITDSDGQRQVELPPGFLHDRASLYPALMAALKMNRLPGNVRLFNGRRIKTYAIARYDNQPVNIALGQFNTIKVQRGQPGDKRIASFWCAPELAYLPVQMVHIEHGKELARFTLDSVSGLDLRN